MVYARVLKGLFSQKDGEYAYTIELDAGFGSLRTLHPRGALPDVGALTNPATRRPPRESVRAFFGKPWIMGSSGVGVAVLWT